MDRSSECWDCGIELVGLRECSDYDACQERINEQVADRGDDDGRPVAEPFETDDEIDARIERWQMQREEQEPPRHWEP